MKIKCPAVGDTRERRKLCVVPVRYKLRGERCKTRFWLHKIVVTERLEKGVFWDYWDPVYAEEGWK